MLLQGNFIADNRNGYMQEGYSINALILDNEIVCNQIEPNPMLGGSGIHIAGASSNCQATIRHNLIKSNLWGVTIQGNAVVDMGTADDFGYNMILENHNISDSTDRLYALMVNGVNDVSAIGNYWGGTTEDFAESVIYHRPDLGEDHGLVTYSPILTVNDWDVQEQKAPQANVFPNPTNGLVTLRVDQAEGLAYEVFNPMGQRVLNGHVNGSEAILDLGPFSTGIYLVTIRADHENIPVFQRIIKQK